MSERKLAVISHVTSLPKLNRSYAVSVRKTSSRPRTGAVSSNGVIGSCSSGKKPCQTAERDLREQHLVHNYHIGANVHRGCLSGAGDRLEQAG